MKQNPELDSGNPELDSRSCLIDFAKLESTKQNPELDARVLFATSGSIATLIVLPGALNAKRRREFHDGVREQEQNVQAYWPNAACDATLKAGRKKLGVRPSSSTSTADSTSEKFMPAGTPIRRSSSGSVIIIALSRRR